jgi:hypothetical protein
MKIDTGKAMLCRRRKLNYIYSYVIKQHNKLKVNNALLKYASYVTSYSLYNFQPRSKQEGHSFRYSQMTTERIDFRHASFKIMV